MYRNRVYVSTVLSCFSIMVYYIPVQKSLPLSRREFLKTAALALPAALSVFALPQPSGSAALAASPAAAPVVFYHGSRDISFVAMTFDDCYDLRLLQQWADFLLQYPKTRMTFFPVGIALENAAAKTPDLWKTLLSQGHEIGYHTYSHSFPDTLSSVEFRDDYDQWYSAASKASGTEPKVRFARPPYGQLSFSFLNLCNQKSLKAAMWTDSWGMADVYFEKEKERSQNGDIILFHIRYQDLENAKIALPYFLNHNQSPVTLSTLYESGSSSEDEIPACRPGPRKVCPR